MQKLTFTMENYLEAVYELRSEKNGSRVTDIAERMGVTKASANNAMSVLAEKGLIINEKYQEIRLTPEGMKLAQSISQKHKLIRSFLIDVLSVDPETADSDACAIEHVISNTSVLAMRDYIAFKNDKID